MREMYTFFPLMRVKEEICPTTINKVSKINIDGHQKDH